MKPGDDAVYSLARQIVERVLSVYREDYIERCVRDEPDSLLALVKRLDAALGRRDTGKRWGNLFSWTITELVAQGYTCLSDLSGKTPSCLIRKTVRRINDNLAEIGLPPMNCDPFCAARTKRGDGCRFRAATGSRYCVFHKEPST